MLPASRDLEMAGYLPGSEKNDGTKSLPISLGEKNGSLKKERNKRKTGDAYCFLCTLGSAWLAASYDDLFKVQKTLWNAYGREENPILRMQTLTLKRMK